MFLVLPDRHLLAQLSRRYTVHAGVLGTVDRAPDWRSLHWERITYDPWGTAGFVLASGGKPVPRSLPVVRFGYDGCFIRYEDLH